MRSPMQKRVDLVERLRARMLATGETLTQLTRSLACAPQTMTKLLRGLRIAPDTKWAITARLDAMEQHERRSAAQIRRHASESQTAT